MGQAMFVPRYLIEGLTLASQKVNIYDGPVSRTSVNLDLTDIRFEPYLPYSEKYAGTIIVTGKVDRNGEERQVAHLLRTNLNNPIDERAAEIVAFTLEHCHPTWRMLE